MPTALAVADVNGDGTPDLVIVNKSNSTVNVLLGNGDGTFQDPLTVATGAGPTAVTVADVNGDGNPDLITADSDGNTVSVLLGNGDGSFQPPLTYAVGSSPASVIVDDFNGDGIPDLAVANARSDTVSVLLGNGDGTFQPPLTYAVGVSPALLVAGDFNGDGYPDLAVADGLVSVLLNAADWTGGPTATRWHSHRPVLRTPAQRQLALALRSSSDVGQRPQLTAPLSPAAIDAALNPVSPWLVRTDSGPRTRPEEMSAPPALLRSRSTQDALFNRWDGALAELLTWAGGS